MNLLNKLSSTYCRCYILVFNVVFGQIKPNFFCVSNILNYKYSDTIF